MSDIVSYKNSTNESARILKSKILLKKYPNSVPVILEKNENDKILPNINKTKYIMPKDMTVSNIIQILKSNMNETMTEHSAIYLLCEDNVMLSGSQSVEYIYNNYKNKDGFLYIKYCGENVFG